MSPTRCIACDNIEGGCERCRGGPGEQGYSLAEQEMMRLRERVRQLEAEIEAHAIEFTPELALVEHCMRTKTPLGPETVEALVWQLLRLAGREPPASPRPPGGG